MEIDYTVNTNSAEFGRPDPLGVDPNVVWELHLEGPDGYRALYADPRAAVDQLARTVADRLGVPWNRALSTENVLAYFSNPAVTSTFSLLERPLNRSFGGGWPSRGERLVPTGPASFRCVCDPSTQSDAFLPADQHGVPAVVVAGQPTHMVHIGCGRIVDVRTAMVTGQLPLCGNCEVPIVFLNAETPQRMWKHISGHPGGETMYCYGTQQSGMVAHPEGDDQLQARPQRPMPGDAVQLTEAWVGGTPAGSIGVIDGMVGEVTDWSSITFSTGGMPSVYRDTKVVRCSGGPGTITTDLSELRPTGTTMVLNVWRFRDGHRRADNDETYQVRVPVWEWNPNTNS